MSDASRSHPHGDAVFVLSRNDIPQAWGLQCLLLLRGTCRAKATPVVVLLMGDVLRCAGCWAGGPRALWSFQVPEGAVEHQSFDSSARLALCARTDALRPMR